MREQLKGIQRERLFARLKSRLIRSRDQLGERLTQLLRGRPSIDAETFEELETLLLTADVGVEASTRIVAELSARAKRQEIADPHALTAALKAELLGILKRCEAPVRQPQPGRPQVILMVGVNGAGKTTTIGKLARRLQQEGNSLMLAAGDTFRAAAVEQLQAWGARNQVPVIAQQSGADAASVIYDALQAATARRVDVLIADTAGRLHTKTNLMEELAKIDIAVLFLLTLNPHQFFIQRCQLSELSSGAQRVRKDLGRGPIAPRVQFRDQFGRLVVKTGRLVRLVTIDKDITELAHQWQSKRHVRSPAFCAADPEPRGTRFRFVQLALGHE